MPLSACLLSPGEYKTASAPCMHTHWETYTHTCTHAQFVRFFYVLISRAFNNSNWEQRSWTKAFKSCHHLLFDFRKKAVSAVLCFWGPLKIHFLGRLTSEVKKKALRCLRILKPDEMRNSIPGAWRTSQRAMNGRYCTQDKITEFTLDWIQSDS